MGCHVQTIGNQRDGAKPPSANNLGEHHGGANSYYSPRLPFVPLMGIA
jgi:hypothetical protein